MDEKSGILPVNMDIDGSQNDGWVASEETTDEIGEQNEESRKLNTDEPLAGKTKRNKKCLCQRKKKQWIGEPNKMDK